jgi:DNA-binding transcriptional LysR family regulator
VRWEDRVGRRIKLSDLHILLAVAQSGSMAKAATQLAVSHPVVSRSIGDLERTLGVRLFDRARHGVELTPYGKALLGRSHAVFDDLRQAVKDIEHLADPNSGEVKIGTTAPLAASFVFSVIDRLSRRHPAMVFNVTVDDTAGLKRSLEERRIELAILRNLGPMTDEHLDFTPLFESPYVVAGGAQNPWTKRRRVRLAELADELWALPAASEAFGPFVEEAFRAEGLPMPRSTVISSTLEMRANLLRTGRYLTIFPEFWLRLPQPHPFIKTLQVKLTTTGGPVGLASVKGRVMSAVARHFVRAAQDVARLI